MLQWQGQKRKQDMADAAVLAINATMTAAIIHARSNHSPGARGSGRFQSQSGELERGTKIVQPARRGRNGVVGRWGVRGVVYARRIELGFQGKDSLGRSFNQPEYPYLRPAAQVEYPKLGGRLRRAYQRA